MLRVKFVRLFDASFNPLHLGADMNNRKAKVKNQ